MENSEVFEGKPLPELLKDIHDNALAKRKTIDGVIDQLTKLIVGANDAVMLAPIIKDFYDVGIKNDDQVVKVATIAQRIITAKTYASGGSSSDLLSEADKELLIKNTLGEMKIEIKEVDEQLDGLKTRVP